MIMDGIHMIDDIVDHMETCARCIEKGLVPPREVVEDIRLWEFQLLMIKEQIQNVVENTGEKIF